jgi:hypothetical protein
MVLELIRDTMRHVVDALTALVHEKAVGDPAWGARVRETAEAASAWVQTFLDCKAVERFRFDPEADPVAAL